MLRHRAVLGLIAAGVVAVAACSGSSTAPKAVESSPAALASVVPAGGATAVNPAAPITLTFTHAMPAAAQMYVELREGSLTGPQVAGTASWSADGMVLTFTPAAVLKAATTYVLHVGGGMVDAAGDSVDYSECPRYGGQSVTPGMMGLGAGGMGGGMGNGGMANGNTGPGWRGGDGTYGMAFTFTTA